ncbi:MAG: hypothetical protein NW218_18375 [Saprospiraceae bacterium]|nr:hypothetical protein [Saprospiraceae bacterium]
MSDFDFLKEFAKNLDRERLHEPADADWEKLAASLDAQAQAKRRRHLMFAWALPLAASVAFILLGTLLWQTSSQADKMQAEIVRLQKELGMKNGVNLADTTVHHVVKIQFDTIYRTVVFQTSLAYSKQSNFHPNNFGQGADSIFQKDQNRQLVNINQKGTESNITFQNESKDTSQSAKPGVETILQKINGIVTSRPIDAVDSFSNIRTTPADLTKIQERSITPDQSPFEDRVPQKMDLSMLPFNDILPPKSLRKRSLPSGFDMVVMVPAPAPPRVPLIRRLRPHDTGIGFTGGMVFPQTKDATPRNSYTLGLSGQMAFGNHLRLLAGAEHGWTNFKVNSSVLDNSNIPPPPTPPTPNDELDYVQVDQPLWDFSMGLRYIFAPEKRLRPFIGAAWMGEQTQEQTLRYNFKNQVTKEETITLVPRNDARFNANGLQIGMGAEWTFTKRLSLGLEGMYQRQYGASVPLLAERWGMKAGVSYRF